MNKRNTNENVIYFSLGKKNLHQKLRKIDEKSAEEMQAGGCRFCGKGVLHRADYDRCVRPVKLLGKGSASDAGTDWEKRFSFCCSERDCRKRHTPASVRFLGRRVYAAAVVVLLTALSHGLSPSRVRRLREMLEMDAKTLKRWRQWWLETFVAGSFWKGFRRRLSPPVCERTLPLSLCERYGIYCGEGRPPDESENEQHSALISLLRALAPLSVPGSKNRVM